MSEDRNNRSEPLPGAAARQSVLSTLGSCGVLEGPADPAFDDLARLAATVCSAPIACVNFVTDDRQYFRSHIGTDISTVPISAGFCPLVVASGEHLVIPDARGDGRFAANTIVTEDPFLRAYAGVPLTTSEKVTIGALFVADRIPRRLTDRHLVSLAQLGRQVVAHVELRLANHALLRGHAHASRPPAPPPDSETHRGTLDSAAPLREERRPATGWTAGPTDQLVRIRAAEKERFLADSSAALASSLEYETTLSTVARLAVPQLADWCVVHIVEPDSTVRQLAVAHVDPEKVKWAETLQTRYPYEPDAARGVPNVLRTGRTEFYPDITDAMLQASAKDDEHLRLMRELGFTSVMIVPMLARGQTLGAITFVSAESGCRYEPSDVAVAEDLAHSAAMAVDNARSFQAAQREIERRQETEAQLRRHQQEIEMLNARLRLSVEVTHHHVRNNLQVILALAQLPVEEGVDTVPVSALGRIEHHTCSLAAMHELLMERAKTDADVGCLSVRTALERLIPLLQATARARPVHFQADDIVLPVQEIGSLCILVNELVTNALKHGDGVVDLIMSDDGDTVRLEVSDEGRGFAADFDWRTTTGTGLCLVDMAGRHDLRGIVTYGNRSEGGGRVVVEFPLSGAA